MIGKLRFLSVTMVVCLLLVTGLGNICFAAAGDYVSVASTGTTRVEAETYALVNSYGSNVTTGATATTYASGSAYKQIDIRAASGQAVPSGGATMTFNLNVATAGLYQLSAVTSTAALVTSYSKYYLKINSGPSKLVDSSVIKSASCVGDPLTTNNAREVLIKYQYNPVYLNAGNNAVVLMLDKYCTRPDMGAYGSGTERYLFLVDYIELTPATPATQSFSYRVNAEDAAVNFTPTQLTQYYSGFSYYSELDGERGQMLKVDANTPTPPAEGDNQYTFTYKVNVPAGGTYKFEAVTSAWDPNNSYYSNSYKVKVNSENYFTAGAAGTVLATTPIKNTTAGYDLSFYRFKDIHLNAGENTIIFKFDKWKTNGQSGTTYRYIAIMDYIKVTLLNPSAVASPATPSTPTTSVTAEDFLYADSSGKYLYSLGNTNYCKAITTLKNYDTGSPASVSLLAALYNSSNQMIKCNVSMYTVPAGESLPAYVDLSGITPAAGNYYKVFVWDNSSDMHPLRTQTLLQ